MNPNRSRAVDVRRQAISDQIEGLERRIAAGQDGEHHRQRFADSRAELMVLGHTWATEHGVTGVSRCTRVTSGSDRKMGKALAVTAFRSPGKGSRPVGVDGLEPPTSAL